MEVHIGILGVLLFILALIVLTALRTIEAVRGDTELYAQDKKRMCVRARAMKFYVGRRNAFGVYVQGKFACKTADSNNMYYGSRQQDANVATTAAYSKGGFLSSWCNDYLCGERAHASFVKLMRL